MEDITSALNTPEGEKYGPTGDGGYNTPFAVTVFYREDKLYQLAIAALSEMCQAIPVGGDLMLLGDACEHPSPDLIIFEEEYTPEHIRKYFQRGFQKIHIFATTKSSITALAEVDSRVSTFTITDMHDGNLKLISNLNAVYIVELIMCGSFPEYKSFIRGINNKNGVAFMGYLQRTLKTPSDIARKLISTTLMMNGYEKVEEMCHQYAGMEEERKILASDRLASSPTIDNKLFVYSADLRNEIIREISSYEKVKYVVLWFVQSDFKIRVTVVKGRAWNDSDPSPLELVKPFCEGTETAIDCVLTDKSFIPIV